MSNQNSIANFVIVFDYKVLKEKSNLTLVHSYLTHLQEHGIKIKITKISDKELIFVCLSLHPRATKALATIYNIEIGNAGHNYMQIQTLRTPQVFQTPLSQDRDIFMRDSEEVTSMERILLINEFLKDSKFEHLDKKIGIQKLENLNIIKAIYPLHDGHYKINEFETDILNDRQVLYKYWSRFTLWYKEQPLNLISKYYGPEVAFYFAWLGFYNRMLIPAAMVGLLCFIGSFISLYVLDYEQTDEICKSDIVMCPICHSKQCFYKPLKQTCAYSRATITFDNYATFFFAIFMSFWATMFTTLWKRQENILKIRWNVEFTEFDAKIRLKYKEKSTHLRLSMTTGELEPYTPPYKSALYLCFSYGACMLLIGVVVLVVLGLILYRTTLASLIRLSSSSFLKTHSVFILMASSALIQVVFIKLFGRFYGPLSIWFTELENPRTQSEFDSSVVHKRYLLAFANNYASLFYIAFFKGRFFVPGKHRGIANAELDICEPVGCLMALCIQLAFLMVFKSLLGNILTLFCPIVVKFLKQKASPKRDDLTQWEEELDLYPTNRYFLTTEFTEMVIQYGFVTFFVGAFPLAPFCALFNNCMELRLDAYKLVARHRRPIPKLNSGIGPWNNILRVVTHLGIATNAFVLAFTSNFVSREIYKFRYGSLKGYIKSVLSVFDMKDYEHYSRVSSLLTQNTSTLCYYKGQRFPPGHPNQYQLTSDYWFDVSVRVLCVIIFEHIIWVTNGLLSFLISDVPGIIKDKIWYDNTAEHETLLKSKELDKNKIKQKYNQLHIRKNIMKSENEA